MVDSKDGVKAKKNICVLLDGRPGHEKQSFGILDALRESCEIEIRHIPVKEEKIAKILSQYLQLFGPGGGLINDLAKNADLLIGTGSKTHLPLLLLKKQYKVPAVTCMMPAAPLRHRFDLCFVPEHDGRQEKANVFLTAGAPNLARNKHGHNAAHGLIALGGIDEKSHQWDDQLIVGKVFEIIDRQKQIFWKITSSPRTPQVTIDMILHCADKFDNARFYHFQDTPPGWIEKQYDQCLSVWVSSDSISMLYEALSAGCRVGIFPMKWKDMNNKFRYNELMLLRKKLVFSFDDWIAGSDSWKLAPELNEAKRCAERILRLWNQKN